MTDTLLPHSSGEFDSHEEYAEAVFDHLGVWETDGHYVFRPKDEGVLHSDVYVHKDMLVKHPAATRELTGLIVADSIDHLPEWPDVVAGIAPVGAKLADHAAAEFALHGAAPLSVFAEKHQPGSDDIAFKRGYEQDLRGKNVFVIEDNVTLATSLRLLILRVREAGGNVIGAGALFNYFPEKIDADALGIPFYKALINKNFGNVRWSQDCAASGLCAQGVPINTERGHGAKWVAEHGQPTAQIS